MAGDELETLKGHAVFVTGGGSGLGAAICAMLGREGARVAVADIEAARASEVVAQLTAQGAQAMALHMDVGNPQQVQAALDSAVERFGPLRAVINNAGIDVTVPVQALDVAAWERVIRTNLTGPFIVAKFALDKLVPGGHIVNITSTAARRAWPNASAYHASKWGLLGLSHALHAELRPLGVKVCAVIAGGMRTPFLLDRFPDIDPTCLQDPANVASAVRFVLTQPAGTVVPEIMVLPMKETSWP